MDKNTTTYKELQKYINNAWGSVSRDGSYPPFFPGPQPISIERKHLHLLTRNEYFACEKTDGTRIALVCCVVDGKKVAVTVNRAMDMTPVSLCMPRGAFDGTILDGEMVQCKNGETHFMLYDAVMVTGKDIKKLNLRERLGEIEDFVDDIVQMPSDKFKIKLKKFYYMKNVKDLIGLVQSDGFPYPTDGLVFTPMYDPIKIGTHDTMFKWKPREKNTVDFLVKNRRNGEIGLYVQERGELIFQSIILPNKITIEWRQRLKDNAIAECEYQWDQWPKWWKPVGIRVDKTHPNNRRTMNRTMVNIEENIQLHEFVQLKERS